ncbi:MAG: CRISPR-associated endonuclease Cas1, partial [Candidatus Peregrinibacteria bacterium]
MKQHLNTLFVTTQGAYLASEGESVLVRVEQETRMRLPIHMIGGIVCFGRVSRSPHLMGLCGERGVTISYLSEHGRFLARVEGPISGNVLLRRAQYRGSEDAGKSAEIARAIVTAKVANCRTVLLRVVRDHPENAGVAEIRTAAEQLSKSLDGLQTSLPLDTVRGIEGES